MSKRVRAIYENFDAKRASHFHDLPHGHDLPREVRDVCDLDDLSPRGDRRPELLDEIAVRRRWDLERDLLEDDPLAPLALLPRRYHPRVVLIGDHHFVAALEIQPEDHDLVRFRRVAGDRHFLRVAPELAGEVTPNTFHPRLEHAPHVLHR